MQFIDFSANLSYILGNKGIMNPKIDDVDREILKCLQIDARMQSSEIARHLEKLTARAVRNRLDRLISQGYITISAAACPEPLGYVLKADIAVDVEPGKVEDVAQCLVALDEVYYVAITTGDTDISTSVAVKTMDDLHNFIGHKLPSIPGVRKTVTNVVTRVLKTSCKWSFPKDLPEL